MSRREFIKLGGMSTLMLTAAACSGVPGLGGNGGGQSNSLSVTQWGTAQRADLYKQALALFEKNNPGVSTNLQFADLASYLDRLTTQAASKSLPDVLWMRDDHVSLYGSQGALLDLSPYLGKGLNTDPLGSGAVADGKVGSGVYALPSHYVGQCVITNATVMQQKGINYDQEVKTWDDLANLAKELADPANKVWGMSDPTLGTTQRHLQAWIRQAGQELFTPDGKLGFTADTFASWLQYWDTLRKAQVIPPADVEVQADAGGMATNPIVTGQAPIVCASSNGLTQVQRLTKTPLSMYSVPQVKGASADWWFFPPILLSVAANTHNQKLSVSLVDFFLNSVPAGLITRVDQGAPSSSAIRDALVPQLDPSEAAFVQQISREMTYPSRPLPVLPDASGQVIQAQTDASQQVAYGRQSISEAVAAFMAAASKALGVS